MKYVTLVLGCFMCTCVTYVHLKAVTVAFHNVEGYYWRDYTGDSITSDALPVRIDDEGRKFYIGQTLHPGASILPGIINHSAGKIFYEYGGKEYSTIEDVKILCSQHPEQLQWIRTKGSEPISSLGENRHLILGGHDRSRPLVIGRITIGTDKAAVGKVLIIDDKFESIYFVKDGKGVSDNSFYEVLVYDPSICTDRQGSDDKVVNIHVDVY